MSSTCHSSWAVVPVTHMEVASQKMTAILQFTIINRAQAIFWRSGRMYSTCVFWWDWDETSLCACVCLQFVYVSMHRHVLWRQPENTSVLLIFIVIQTHSSHAHSEAPNKFHPPESSIQTSTTTPAGFSLYSLLRVVFHFLCFSPPRLSFPLSFCLLLLLLCHFLPLWSKKERP